MAKAASTAWKGTPARRRRESPYANIASLPFLRHEGKAHLFLFSPLLLFFCWQQRKRVIVSAVIAFVVFFGVKQGLYPSLAVKNATALADSPFWGTTKSARAIKLAHAKDLPMPNAMYDFAASMGFPGGTYSGPYPYGMQQAREVLRTIRDSGRVEDAREHSSWVKKRYPLVHYNEKLTERLSRAPYLFGITDQIRQGLITPIINVNHAAVREQDFDAKYRLLKAPLTSGGRALLEPLIGYFSKHHRWLYSQPVINFYAVVIAAIILLVACRRDKARSRSSM